MAYIVITTREGHEIDRRELTEAISIGRAMECSIRLHDILLSREHCRLEADGNGFVLIDLDSRNGTLVNGERISRKTLREGDRIVVGSTHILFHEGAFVPASGSPRAGLMDRPADPFEALSATVMGVEVDMKFEAPIERPILRPTPRPMPVASKMRREAEVLKELTAIATSSTEPNSDRGELSRFADPVMLSLPAEAAGPIKSAPSPRWGLRKLPTMDETQPALEVVLPALQRLPEMAIVGKRRWRRRAFWLIAESVLLAGLVGGSVLWLLNYLPNHPTIFNRFLGG